MRYAIQRALIDQGFAAEPGYLLSSLQFVLPCDWVNEESVAQTTIVSRTDNLHPTPPAEEKLLRAPVQVFIQRPLQAKLFKGSNDSRFKCVAVIWLPEVHAWRRTEGEQNQYLDVLIKALNDSGESKGQPFTYDFVWHERIVTGQFPFSSPLQI